MHGKYCPFITTIVALILLMSALAARGVAQRRGRLQKKEPAAQLNSVAPTGEPIGKRILFSDGLTLDVDDAWMQGRTVWYRSKGTSQSVSRPVRSIEIRYREVEPAKQPTVATAPAKTVAANPTLATWIYLTDGARLRVDELREVADGAWYNRNNVSIFLARDRIGRIEREQPETAGGEWNEHGWSSGNALVDDLIRTNGTRFGVDPYLVFLVIEQESHFRTKAVSPKGARGLMQLMPGTARRFGVKQSFDPGQNIRGGTQYLKELLTMFDGRVDLALASYNAGEGRVLDYGNRVPPFKETREYVKRISTRYKKKQQRDTGNK